MFGTMHADYTYINNTLWNEIIPCFLSQTIKEVLHKEGQFDRVAAIAGPIRFIYIYYYKRKYV